MSDRIAGLRWALLGLGVRLRGLRAESRAPTQAVPRLGEAWWRDRLAAKRAALAGGEVRLAFIGDSLTHNWEIAGAAAWDRHYGHRAAVNLGYAGDTTGTVLWRIRDGELDSIRPRVLVVLIGINDIIAEGKRAEAVVANLDAIVAELRRRLPAARILLLGLLPNRVLPWITRESARVNAMLAARDWSRGPVAYLDTGHALLKGGRIDPGLFGDALADPPVPILLHPNAPAYDLIARAMEPTLVRLLEDGPARATQAIETPL